MRTLILITFMTQAISLLAEETRPKIVLKNAECVLSVDLEGGAIDRFELIGQGLNPLSWDSWQMVPNRAEKAPPGPRAMGHFLCLDRWGPPSENERLNGMPKHGEASSRAWKADTGDSPRDAHLQAKLPLAGFRVEREVTLLDGVSVFKMVEHVTNENALGRIYNIVQHPTIGNPFLDTSTVVDCNGTRGFMQDREMPMIEEPEVRWPKAIRLDGTEVDYRFLDGDQTPNVTTYLVEEEYGWITATNASKGLLIGYLWKREDYPWINLWRHAPGGVPMARGLEFGTSGLHRPMADVAAKKEIFGESLFRFVDAGETQSYRYACFLQRIPESFSGVAEVSYDGEKIRIHELENGGVFEIEAKELF